MKQYGKYFATLVGLYIVLSSSNAANVFSAGAKGVSDVTKSLQGRS